MNHMIIITIHFKDKRNERYASLISFFSSYIIDCNNILFGGDFSSNESRINSDATSFSSKTETE